MPEAGNRSDLDWLPAYFLQGLCWAADGYVFYTYFEERCVSVYCLQLSNSSERSSAFSSIRNINDKW